MSTVTTDPDLSALAAKLSWDQRDILQALWDDGWCRPMDLGASDGSFHSSWLKKLVTLGLAERKNRAAFSRRGSYTYRRTALGTQVLNYLQKAQSK